MDEVHRLPFQAGQHRVIGDALERVPPDVRKLFPGGQPVHRSLEDAKTGRPIFRARVEQELQAEADAEEGSVLADGVAQRSIQAACSKGGHRWGGGPHTGKDDGVRVHEPVRRRRDHRLGAERVERVLHAAQVAGAVVDQRDHFVLADRSASVASIAHP